MWRKAFYSLILPQHQACCAFFLLLGKCGAYQWSLISSLAVTDLNFFSVILDTDFPLSGSFLYMSCNFQHARKVALAPVHVHMCVQLFCVLRGFTWGKMLDMHWKRWLSGMIWRATWWLLRKNISNSTLFCFPPSGNLEWGSRKKFLSPTWPCRV